jgi:hypothetical protein
MAKPKPYAELRDNVVVNIVMMEPAVAEGTSANEDTPSTYVDISTIGGECNIGYEIVDGQFAPPSDLIERQWGPIRKERDRLLCETDWIVIKAKESGSNLSAAWKTYRQSLRDITTTFATPEEVVFPDKP